VKVLCAFSFFCLGLGLGLGLGGYFNRSANIANDLEVFAKIFTQDKLYSVFSMCMYACVLLQNMKRLTVN
jgi:hypothetical protein